jgi:hypothetical protein
MAFLIYERTPAGSEVRYRKLAPLKMGGRDGLIARHVKALPDRDARGWKLEVTELLRLAGHAGTDAGGRLTVLFDVTGRDATSVCLYELLRIHGSCRDTSTQLALDFSVVLDEEVGDDAASRATAFGVIPPERPKLLGETLSLSGGPGGGDWKWGTPPMQLGATIVHGQPGHGSGEPCANCSCGKRATGA